MASYPLSACLRGQGRAAPCLGLPQGDAYEQGKAGGERGSQRAAALLGKGLGHSTRQSHRSLLPEEYFQNKSHQSSLVRVDSRPHVLAAGTASWSPHRVRDCTQKVGSGLGNSCWSRCKWICPTRRG